MAKDILEVCCGSLQDALRAEKGGADRIELKTAQALGGLSCGRTLLRQVQQAVNLPIMVTIRCKPGGFYYSDDEMDLMFNQASQLLEGGADGIVFGFLNPDKTVEEDRTAQMVDLAHGYGKQAVFNRAFDAVPDRDAAIQKLIELGVDRVVTSAGSQNCEDGAEDLAYLKKTYGDKIQILPCGDINGENIGRIREKTGCHQFHSSCKGFVPDYPGDNSMMRQEVDLDVVKDIASQLHGDAE